MSAARAHRRFGRVARALATLSIVALGLAAVAIGPAGGTTRQNKAAQPTASAIVGDAARPVAEHAAVRLRDHAANAVLSLNVGLAVRHSAELDAVIRAASTPGTPEYGHYLTPAQYDAQYAPTDTEVAAVRDWLAARGVRVTGVTPDNLMVSAAATTATAERAFGVSVNDYRAGARTFFSNAAAPTVPADLGVRWISGLNNFDVPKAFATSAPARAPAFRGGGYFPSDFRTAYNVDTVPLVPPGRANDESIGFTLWGAPLVQSDLTAFATNTGSQLLTINHVGSDGIDFIPCSTSTCVGVLKSTDKSPWIETSMDVEDGHGIAPGTHLKYWLGSTSNQGGSLHPDLPALEHAVSAAANDATVKVVSNSWGFSADAFDPNIDTALQHAASVGKTFFFSSGDTPEISYPATSPYVVAVGGTSLNLAATTFSYVSESTWSDSGFGCSSVFARPTWQTDLGSQTLPCTGRIEPDVAADADQATGAYVVAGSNSFQVGGTSLSAPLWAGMTAVWNEAKRQAVQPGVGFVAPLLYSLGGNPSAGAFHDVAPSGWDQRTGWGSPRLATMITDAFNETATTTHLYSSKNPVAFRGSAVFTAIVSPTPTASWVTFRKDGAAPSGCLHVTLVGGRASCTMTFSPPGTYHVQAQYGGNAAFAGSASNVIAERGDPPPAGYWMAGQKGAVYAFGARKYHGNASTTNVTHFEPSPSLAGYWIVNRAGQVFAFGDAHPLGNATGLAAGETVSSLSSTPSGLGYWLFTSRGRALRFGDAHSYGDLSGKVLNQPVIGSVATPTGHGYYMVASDGGIFAFGDARFFGSTGGIHLNKPVNGLVPTATNRGYWMVASDGGIFAFGDARFLGSMGGTTLNQPVVGMVRYGNGYLMVGSDGGIFDFSDQPFLGSLAGKPLPAPIVSVAS